MTTAFIRESSLLDLVHIARHLSVLDRLELGATRDPDNAEDLALDAWHQAVKFTAFSGRDAEAIMAFGVGMPSPDYVTVWGFKTERYREVIRPVTKFVCRTMLPELRDKHGVQRAECVVHPDNSPSRRWLAFLGFELEATLSGFGNRQEDMLLYARSR